MTTFGVPTGTIRRAVAPGQFQFLADNPQVGPTLNQVAVDAQVIPTVGIGHNPFKQTIAFANTTLAAGVATIPTFAMNPNLKLPLIPGSPFYGGNSASSGWVPAPAITAVGSGIQLGLVGVNTALQYARFKFRTSFSLTPSGAQTNPTGYTNSFLAISITTQDDHLVNIDSVSDSVPIISTGTGSAAQSVHKEYSFFAPYSAARNFISFQLTLTYATGGTTTLLFTNVDSSIELDQ